MQPGDKVIYFKSLDANIAPARIGTLLVRFPDGFAVIATDMEGPARTTVRDGRVYPYSDDLWNAWLQWQQNAGQLSEQYRQLASGQAPEALLASNVFNLF